MEKREEKGLTTRTNSRGQQVWYVRCAVNGKMQHFGGFHSKQIAKSFYDSIKKRERKDRLAFLTIGRHYIPGTQALLPHHVKIGFESAIYFIECLPHGPIKIGFTTQLFKRIPSLIATNGIKTRFLGAIYGSKAEERVLHRKFAQSNEHHEWFSLTVDLIEFLVHHGMEPMIITEMELTKQKGGLRRLFETEKLKAAIFAALPPESNATLSDGDQ